MLVPVRLSPLYAWPNVASDFPTIPGLILAPEGGNGTSYPSVLDVYAGGCLIILER